MTTFQPTTNISTFDQSSYPSHDSLGYDAVPNNLTCLPFLELYRSVSSPPIPSLFSWQRSSALHASLAGTGSKQAYGGVQVWRNLGFRIVGWLGPLFGSDEQGI